MTQSHRSRQGGGLIFSATGESEATGGTSHEKQPRAVLVRALSGREDVQESECFR